MERSTEVWKLRARARSCHGTLEGGAWGSADFHGRLDCVGSRDRLRPGSQGWMEVASRPSSLDPIPQSHSNLTSFKSHLPCSALLTTTLSLRLDWTHFAKGSTDYMRPGSSAVCSAVQRVLAYSTRAKTKEIIARTATEVAVDNVLQLATMQR